MLPSDKAIKCLHVANNGDGFEVTMPMVKIMVNLLC